MLIVPKNAAQAAPLLDEVRTQRQYCTMFVLEDGDAGSQLASKADVRAENHPFRKVVWVQDTSVLGAVTGYDVVSTAAKAGAIVCTMTFDFRQSSTFAQGDAVDLLSIERAFIKAERGD